jgi:hypothetical protein
MQIKIEAAFSDGRKILREWIEVAAFAAGNLFDACDFHPFAYSKDTTTRVVRSIG